MARQRPSMWKPSPLSLSEAENAEIRQMIEDGEAPPDAFEQNAEAARKNVYGFDYKTDRNGNPIPVGIGAPGRETSNHFQSIRRYEGQAAYERAVRDMFKRDPERAKSLGLILPRVGA